MSLGPPDRRNDIGTTCNKGNAHQGNADQEKNEESLHVLGLQTYWTEMGFIQIYDFINSGDLPLLPSPHRISSLLVFTKLHQ